VKPEGLLLLCSYSRAFQMFQDAVSQHGFVPIPCFTLQEAESAISNRELAAIVCSGQVLDGTYHRLFEFLARAGKAVPVFVVLSDCGPEQRAEAQHLGAAGCMPRPASQFDVEQVVGAIARHVGRDQARKEELV